MLIISPVTIDDSSLLSSNVPEDDAPMWSAGSYFTDDEVIYNHRVYRALSDNSDQPDVGAAATPATWNDLGATNRYRAFDQKVAQQTTNDDLIDVTIRPGGVINAVAFFNCSCASVRVIVDDPADGIVYDQTRQMSDSGSVTSWYQYFSEPITPRSDAVFLDMPRYGTADVRMIVSAPNSTAAVGEIVFGLRRELGDLLFGAEIGLDDFSVKERDEFGNFNIVPRLTANTVSLPVSILRSKTNAVRNMLRKFTTVPIVYIGAEGLEETYIYGYYTKLRLIMSNGTYADCSLDIEGLT